MNKSIIIAGGILLIVLIAFIIVGPSSGTGAVITSKIINDLKMTEEQRYAMFEAEVTCELMTAFGENLEDPENFIQTTLEIIEKVSSKYDYTTSEIETNRVKYENNLEVQRLAQGYALEICPEIDYRLEMDN